LFEHYLKSVGIVEAGWFYKDLSDPIFQIQTTPTTGRLQDSSSVSQLTAAMRISPALSLPGNNTSPSSRTIERLWRVGEL